jgi:purine-binding chemotaxis protein CheW
MTVSATSLAAEANSLGAAALSLGHEARVGAAPTQLISFAIGDDQYGVDIMAVREIKGWTEITHLPRQPDYVRGVLNLRGVIVPIIDLRCRFGQGLTQATPLHIVIIVQIAAKPVGLLADRVLDIVSLDETQIQPVPRIAQASRVEFLSGLATVEGAMIALIDLPNLLAAQVELDAADATPTIISSGRWATRSTKSAASTTRYSSSPPPIMSEILSEDSSMRAALFSGRQGHQGPDHQQQRPGQRRR